MTKGQEDLIRYKLSRAGPVRAVREPPLLPEARVMLQTGHPYGAVNRIYYACFYAVAALLITRNLSSSRHSGVIALFNRHFIKPGLISVNMGKFYSRMFDSRLENDYADWMEAEEQDIKEELVRA